MLITNLLPTHNTFRSKDTISLWKKYLSVRGKTLKFNPVNLVFISDHNKYLIWNGHHRISAAYQVGIMELLPSEYNVKNFTLQELNTINRCADYLTPFNPLTEVRLPEFFDYKQKARYNSDEWIYSNKYLYLEKRLVNSVQEMFWI